MPGRLRHRRATAALPVTTFADRFDRQLGSPVQLSLTWLAVTVMLMNTVSGWMPVTDTGPTPSEPDSGIEAPEATCTSQLPFAQAPSFVPSAAVTATVVVVGGAVVVVVVRFDRLVVAGTAC